MSTRFSTARARRRENRTRRMRIPANPGKQVGRPPSGREGPAGGGGGGAGPGGQEWVRRGSGSAAGGGHLFAHQFLNVLHAADEIVAGFGQPGGVVNNMRSEEDDHFGTAGGER